MIEDKLEQYISEGKGDDTHGQIAMVSKQLMKGGSYAKALCVLAVLIMIVASGVAEADKDKKALRGKAKVIFGFAKTLR